MTSETETSLRRPSDVDVAGNLFDLGGTFFQIEFYVAGDIFDGDIAVLVVDLDFAVASGDGDIARRRDVRASSILRGMEMSRSLCTEWSPAAWVLASRVNRPPVAVIAGLVSWLYLSASLWLSAPTRLRTVTVILLSSAKVTRTAP